VAGLSGGHKMKVRVRSSTKATWRDRTWAGGHRVKSLICEEFREAIGRVDSKEGSKGKPFAFLDQERGGCQGPKACGPSPGCGV
jgi:hypothetical protein